MDLQKLASELEQIAQALRLLKKRYRGDPQQALDLAIVNLLAAIGLDAFNTAEFVELRYLASKPTPPESVDARHPAFDVVAWFGTRRMLPDWFRELPSFLWFPDAFDLLADLIDQQAACTRSKTRRTIPDLLDALTDDEKDVLQALNHVKAHSCVSPDLPTERRIADLIKWKKKHGLLKKVLIRLKAHRLIENAANVEHAVRKQGYFLTEPGRDVAEAHDAV